MRARPRSLPWRTASLPSSSYPGPQSSAKSRRSRAQLPRPSQLAGGGIRINLTKIEVQSVKTTDQVLILLTGEASASPPGRFSQVFVLQPVAGGGMYVKLDVIRFGAGAAPQNVGRDPAGMASCAAQRSVVVAKRSVVDTAALRSALCALRSALCALRSALCILRFALCAPRFALCDLRSLTPPALAHPHSRPQAMGFLQSYFGAMAQNKQALAQAYRENSELTLETQHFRGLREIQAKLAAVPPREGEDASAVGFVKPVPDGARNMVSLDALPLVAPAAPGAAPAAVLALVTGLFTGAGETNALPFAQAFVLVNDAASGSYCGDDVFIFAL